MKAVQEEERQDAVSEIVRSAHEAAWQKLREESEAILRASPEALRKMAQRKHVPLDDDVLVGYFNSLVGSSMEQSGTQTVNEHLDDVRSDRRALGDELAAEEKVWR